MKNFNIQGKLCISKIDECGYVFRNVLFMMHQIYPCAMSAIINDSMKILCPTKFGNMISFPLSTWIIQKVHEYELNLLKFLKPMVGLSHQVTKRDNWTSNWSSFYIKAIKRRIEWLLVQSQFNRRKKINWNNGPCKSRTCNLCIISTML